MSSPIFGFAGVCYATIGLLSEYSQLPARDCEKALAELLNSGAIIKFGDYLVIKNYLLFNKCSGDKIETKLINDFNALPKEVFAGIMSIPIIKEVYLRSCTARDREPRDTNGLIAVSDYLPVQIELKPKPVVKKSLTPESEQITRLRGYAKAIFDEIGSSKNKPELSTEQYQKLIDKWGYDKLVILQRVFYEWKAIKKDKATATDFGTLFKKGWVHEKADTLSDSSQYDSGNTPTPEPRENPPSGGWLYPFPKPEGLDGMEFYAKKELLSKLMSEYNASKEALNPKPASNPEPPKEDFWKYDFPKPEFWDGMKQAAKDAYIARETMKEVENVIDSLPD